MAHTLQHSRTSHTPRTPELSIHIPINSSTTTTTTTSTTNRTTMHGLAASAFEGETVTKLIAQTARRLSVPAVDQSELPLPRESLSPQQRKSRSSFDEMMDAPCPFRRSLSQPENMTSDLGDLAMAEETSEMPHSSAKKLVLLRRFSVSEEDVVICNRVRCGMDPSWFRHRSTGPNGRRYQRSLSVEEARLAATRKRLSLHRKSGLLNGPASVPFVVPENEALEDPALLSASTKISSPRARVEAPEQAEEADEDKDEEEEEEEEEFVPKFKAGVGPAPLTPREKAMHGRYLIRESFANGSYGEVWAGEDNKSHQEVAVKIIPKYILVSPEEKQSVIREQIIHKSLDHPHIIKLIDVFEDEGAHYFILERADNGSLSTLITYAGMPEDQCRIVFRQLLQALEYLHRNNIVHHDIKPHNILLHKGGGDIKLCDFGASRAFNASDASLPFAGVFGTPGYIAPELLLGNKAYGPAIDMFSAGILLFEMVFGYTPFYPPSACTYQPLDFPPKAPASPQVQQLIQRLLEKDPAQRITASQALGHPWITGGTTGRSAPNSPINALKVASPRAHSKHPLERCLSS